MRFSFYLFLFSCCLSGTTQAQSLKAYLQAGETAVERGDYYTALLHYETVIQYEPENQVARYDAGRCAMGFHAYPRALSYFEEVAKSDQQRQLPNLYFEMARSHRALGQYEEARTYYQQFLGLQSTQKDANYLALAPMELEACRWAQAQTALPASHWKVNRFNKQVNTPYSEFSGVWHNDTLYFASLRYESPNDKQSPPRSLSKLLYRTQGRRARLAPGTLNDSERHTANPTFSSDGKCMVYTLCSYLDDSYRIRCALYSSQRDKRGRWSKGKPLPDSLNLKGYTHTQPCLAFDSTLQKELLYFASDRPAGKGGMDLWYSWQEEGVWQEPVNLSSLNTMADELTPFFHASSQTLYFSSDGLPGMGGIDVYSVSRRDSVVWTNPVNLGIPVNSSYDDFYYNLLPHGKEGLFSSNRPEATRIDKDMDACCHDLFQVQYLPPQDPPDTEPPLTGLDPKFPSENADPSLEPGPTALEDLLPLPLYFDNDEPDKRTRRTGTRKQYGETYASYYERKADFEAVFRNELQPEQARRELDKLEDFFEDEVRYGQETLLRFSAQLLERLQEGDEVEIFIKGYTSPRAQSSYNLALGQRRVSSVVNHFEAYADGALLPYLRNGKLRITQRSFGATQAPDYVIADLDDTLNSIYSIEASRERRVVLEEIRLQERD